MIFHHKASSYWGAPMAMEIPGEISYELMGIFFLKHTMIETSDFCGHLVIEEVNY